MHAVKLMIGKASKVDIVMDELITMTVASQITSASSVCSAVC